MLSFIYESKGQTVNRFQSLPKNFTWDELSALLKILGYQAFQAGKTSGSRVRFVHSEYPPIMLHKPHPTKILKHYQLREILTMLSAEGIL